MNEEPVVSTSPAELPAASYGASAPVGDVAPVPAVKTRRFGCLGICMTIAGCALLFLLLTPVTRSSREPARRTQCMNNLKQIVLALEQYHEVYGAYPPAHTVDRYGKPLHSWRTLILPYLDSPDYQKRYDSIDLSEPWDDPANASVDQSAPAVYRCPTNASMPETHTNYLAVVVPDGWFLPNQPRSCPVVEGHNSSSVRVIEVPAKKAVHWMSPMDADEQLLAGLLDPEKAAHYNGMHAAMGTCNIRFISAEIRPTTFRELMSAKGTEKEF